MARNTTLESPTEQRRKDAASGVRPIARDELKERIDRHEHFNLVETLAPEQFQEAHLPGAINMPPDRIADLAPVLLPDKNAEIVTYCASRTCHASADAARELVRLGYTNVRHYAGGKADWTFAGFPVERGGR